MRLTKDSPIEIYRARLPGSVRLVVSHRLGILSNNDAEVSYKYHIDVIHEFGKDVW